MMNIDFEYITALKGFIQPVLFPFKSTWKDQQILAVDGVGEAQSILEQQFPEAVVTQLDVESVLSSKNRIGTFDYIAASGLKSRADDIPGLLVQLLSLLKPGGIISAGVYGYAGYYGLEMLSTIIKNFSKDIKDISDKKNAAKLIRVGKAVIGQLPANHPAFQRQAFMERLKKGDKKAFVRLINLSKDKIFTVSQLLECIERCGGRLVDWVFPNVYDPARYIKKEEIVKKLAALPEPQRWKAAELIDAAPAEHYFFLGKKDHQPIKAAWDSNDLYLWKPVRLPLYRWEDIKDPGAGSCTLQPIGQAEGIGSMELQSWQVQFCLSASGASTVDQLLKKSSPQVSEFLKRAVEARLLALLPPSV